MSQNYQSERIPRYKCKRLRIIEKLCCYSRQDYSGMLLIKVRISVIELLKKIETNKFWFSLCQDQEKMDSF